MKHFNVLFLLSLIFNFSCNEDYNTVGIDLVSTSDFNTKTYGRLTILANWRLNIKKICDVSPVSFKPKPKIDSTVLFFKPKKE